MEQQKIIDYTIPLWAILTFIGTWVITAITVLVRLHYSDKQKTKDMTSLSNKIEQVKKEFTKELTEHKQESKERIENVNKDVDEIRNFQKNMNDTLITIKTHTELLILGKIKTKDEQTDKK